MIIAYIKHTYLKFKCVCVCVCVCVKGGGVAGWNKKLTAMKNINIFYNFVVKYTSKKIQ